jgi:protein-tyrosine phosphatase
MQIPSVSAMLYALDTIDRVLADRRAIYIHCWGGIGRTGTVVGCYLVRHGLTGEVAIQEIAHLRQHTPDYRYPAPARDIQRQMVCSWQRGM